MKQLELSVFVVRQVSANDLNHLNFLVESIVRSTVPIANSRRWKEWRCLFTNSLGRVKMLGDFVKYNLPTHESFVTEICTARGTKMSTQPSSLRPDLGCSSDELEEIPAVPPSNTLVQVLVRQTWVVTEACRDNFVEAAHVIRFPAAKFYLTLLLLSKPVSIVPGTLPEVEAKESEVNEPSAKQAWFAVYNSSCRISLAVDFNHWMNTCHTWFRWTCRSQR